MSLTPDQVTKICEYLADEFYQKYGWRVGPDDFARVCDTARPGSLQLEPIQDLLTTNLNLTRTGRFVDETTPMQEILLRVDVDLKTRYTVCHLRQ